MRNTPFARASCSRDLRYRATVSPHVVVVVSCYLMRSLWSITIFNAAGVLRVWYGRVPLVYTDVLRTLADDDRFRVGFSIRVNFRANESLR